MLEGLSIDKGHAKLSTALPPFRSVVRKQEMPSLPLRSSRDAKSDRMFFQTSKRLLTWS